jgi:hypothetical protein
MKKHPKNRSSPLITRLVTQATEYAEKHLRRQGHMPPMLHGVTSDNQFMLKPGKTVDEDGKNHFALLARLLCLAHPVLGVVFVAEVWAAEASPDGAPDTPPSEAFNRLEYVMISVEINDGTLLQKLLPIIRSDNGKFFGLGEAEMTRPDSVRGRFARFLPPEEPSAAERQNARSLLEVLQQLGRRHSKRVRR